MLDHLVNDDLSQADDDLEGSEEELELAGREWKRMEERSLKEGFRSDAVAMHVCNPESRLMFGVNAGKGGALLKKKHSRRVLTRATLMVSPGPSKLAD